MKRFLYFNHAYLDKRIIVNISTSTKSNYSIKIELDNGQSLIEILHSEHELNIRIKNINKQLGNEEMLKAHRERQESPIREPFTFFTKVLLTPEVKRRGVKNIFQEMQEEYERKQVEGSGYENKNSVVMKK